jgi:hypothetical protein
MYKIRQNPRPASPYPRNAWPTRPDLSKKDPKPVFEKTREVLRHVYPANASGSKIVTISLDPALDFEPVVTFAKTGFSGVKLDPPAFYGISDNAEFISAYFRGEVSEAGQMQLSHDITLAFERSYGNLAIVLKQGVQSQAEKSVTLAGPTWTYVCNLLPLLQHIHKQLSFSTACVNQMCEDMVRHIGSNFRPAGGNVPRLSELETYMKTMLPQDVPDPDNPEGPVLDKERIFYELRHFCMFDIAGALKMNTDK